jgi:hypothetical protein
VLNKQVRRPHLITVIVTRGLSPYPVAPSGWSAGSTAGRAVGQLAEDVGMPGVAAGLLDHVDQCRVAVVGVAVVGEDGLDGFLRPGPEGAWPVCDLLAEKGEPLDVREVARVLAVPARWREERGQPSVTRLRLCW